MANEQATSDFDDEPITVVIPRETMVEATRAAVPRASVRSRTRTAALDDESQNH